MNFFDLVDISEQTIEILDPTSEKKLIRAGEVAGMGPGRKVIDFGCGYGTALVLWAEKFGISGIGIDLRQRACLRATKKISENNLSDKIEIVCGKGSEYDFKKHSYHVAAAIGTSFIWKDFPGTIRAMREAITSDGRLIVGEPYWKYDKVPSQYMGSEKIFMLNEILQITRQEGFDIEFIIPAELEDWDNYETANWSGLLRWIEANPNHPERQDVIDFLRKSQDDYMTYQRQCLGWAIFILNPVKY